MKRGMKISFILALVSILCVYDIRADIIWDGGYHEFSEGFEGEIDMINGAMADITGGEIGMLLCWDTTEVFVYEPSVIDLLRPNDSSIANVYGGTVNYVFALGSSTTNIYRGFLDEIAAEDFSILNLYVESYEWDPTGGARDGGLLTGLWLGTAESFSIDLVSEGTINHINFVPEPATLAIFGLGSLFLRR